MALLRPHFWRKLRCGLPQIFARIAHETTCPIWRVGETTRDVVPKNPKSLPRHPYQGSSTIRYNTKGQHCRIAESVSYRISYRKRIHTINILYNYTCSQIGMLHLQHDHLNASKCSQGLSYFTNCETLSNTTDEVLDLGRVGQELRG